MAQGRGFFETTGAADFAISYSSGVNLNLGPFD
jgi:hypothetical protein